MKQTQGRFLMQSNKDFPADCEMLDYMQTNAHVVSVIGNVAGDKAILLGCEVIGETQRKEGYVFLRTKEHPEGEVLFWEGGPVASGMYLKQEPIAVQANGYDYPEAYVRRSLAAGIGTENYKWADFHELNSLPELMEEIDELRAALAKVRQPLVGSVTIWAGKEVPDGYMLCNGQSLKSSEYPELYDVIGDMYNYAPDYEGNTGHIPVFGYFRLPDLRGRFLVGYNENDSDYDTLGNAGGEKHHVVSAVASSILSDSETSYDNISCATSESMGGMALAASGETYENRPPYYVLSYIIRVK